MCNEEKNQFKSTGCDVDVDYHAPNTRTLAHSHSSYLKNSLRFTCLPTDKTILITTDRIFLISVVFAFLLSFHFFYIQYLLFISNKCVRFMFRNVKPALIAYSIP